MLPKCTLRRRCWLAVACLLLCPSRQFAVMHLFGSDWFIADMVRASGRYERRVAHRIAAGWVTTACGPRNGLRIRHALLRSDYVHLGFVFVLVAERSPAEGSVVQIFKCLKRLDDFHANPKHAGSVEKRRKGFGDAIWRFVESLRFACLRQDPREPKENRRGHLVSSQFYGGGGRGTGIQRSPFLWAADPPEGEELGSNVLRPFAWLQCPWGATVRSASRHSSSGTGTPKRAVVQHGTTARQAAG
jgi:hypothetical protein